MHREMAHDVCAGQASRDYNIAYGRIVHTSLQTTCKLLKSTIDDADCRPDPAGDDAD